MAPGPIGEAIDAPTPLGSDLAAGLENLDLNQEITFTQYIRLVLPLDGFVFWVRADLVSPSAIIGALKFNSVPFNAMPSIAQLTPTFVVAGSLHYSTDLRQEEGENYAANRMVFTAQNAVNNLNDIAPNQLWIAEFHGRRFAFSSRSSRYVQAGIHHYVGFAIYPDMETQIVDSMLGFNALDVVVSNSLPAWLALNGYVPAYGFGNPSLPLFPSFLSPLNEQPPFATVHIEPATTRALASAPTIDPATSTHTQLCAETVRVTLWGCRNKQALDFIDCVYQYSADFGLIGLMNMPAVRDEKRTQSELGTIAQKKIIEFEVSYLQHRMNDVAMQIIKTAVPDFLISAAA